MEPHILSAEGEGEVREVWKNTEYMAESAKVSKVENGGRSWKDTVVINEQRAAGSFVPWQPAQITVHGEILRQLLGLGKFIG